MKKVKIMVYDNNYVSILSLMGRRPSLASTAMSSFNSCQMWLTTSVENGDYLCLDQSRRFSPDVEVDPNDFFFETFFGFQMLWAWLHMLPHPHLE